MIKVALIGKGGGGKTTTAINLAVVARRRGFKVGIIDADPQRSLSHWRVARGGADIPLQRSITEQQLQTTIDLARRSMIDFLFVDMPPAHAAHTFAAIASADFTLVLMRPMLFDLAVARKWIACLRSTARPFAVVLNAAPPRREGVDAPMVRDARGALYSLGAAVWRGQITHRAGIAYASISGRGAAETEPDGPAATEYTALFQAINKVTSTPRSIIHDRSSPHAA
jgi:chromosome partitioning protein